MEFQNWISESQLTESSTGSPALLELITYKLPQTKNSTELLKIVKCVWSNTVNELVLNWTSPDMVSEVLASSPHNSTALTALRSRLGPRAHLLTISVELRRPKDKTLQESDFSSLVLCLASFQTVSAEFHNVVLLRAATGGEAGFSRITHTHNKHFREMGLFWIRYTAFVQAAAQQKTIAPWLRIFTEAAGDVERSVNICHISKLESSAAITDRRSTQITCR